jgi:hypothetical protein
LNDNNLNQETTNCNVIPLFPSLILSQEISEYKELLEVVTKLRRQDARGMDASNMGGWHSQYQNIPDLITKYIPFPKYYGVSWYMVNTNLQGNYSHTHPRNDWAGVLWLKVPPNAAKLEFEHPDCFAQYDAIQSIHDNNPTIQQQTNYYKAYSFTPKEGQLLMFPSSLRHRVYFSNTNEERISMSFNIKIDET